MEWKNLRQLEQDLNHMVSIIFSHPLLQYIAANSPSLLHCWLGHPSLDKLKKMVPHFSQLESLECESCQLGKHFRASFPSSISSRASSPFDVIHSDVWVPSHVLSVLGYRYYVTFIDDFSHCTWIFLMKDRSELFNIFSKFLFRNQNSIRSDNSCFT